MRYFFGRNPILKLVIPFILGITVMWFCSLSLQTAFLLLLAGGVLLLSGIFDRLPKFLFGIGATIVMFSLGAVVQALDNGESLQRWSDGKGRFEAVLLEVPQMQARSTKVRAEVMRIGRDSVHGMRRKGVVYIYFANSVEAEQLQIGERIRFEGKVLNPRNAGNPAEFDFEHYCRVNGVSGTAFLPVDGWHSVGIVPLTFGMRALLLREKIVEKYRSMNFSDENLSVLSALTVGDKSELDTSVKELYSTVGASHVLALSGLHLGIFYMIMSFLFPLKSRRRVVLIFREVSILLFLWGFVFVAGLSPSLIRAAILFTLMSLARCMHRDASSVNSLAFAALAMLLYSPRYLFNVSFQLSFSAVFAILILQPWLRRLLRADDYGVLYRYIVDIFAVSVSAQIGVLPFIWYYFGSFPVYFLLTNPVVVPLAFVIMCLAVLLLLLTPLPFLQQCVAFILENLLSFQNNVLEWIASLPFASFQLPYIGVAGACMVALVMILLLHGLIHRSVPVVSLSLLLSLLLSFGSCVYLYSSHETEEAPYVLFYNSPDCSAVQLVVSSSDSYLISSYPFADVDLSYVAEPYWMRERMTPPRRITDGYSDENISCVDGLISFSGRKIKLLAADFRYEDADGQPVDCLYLCRGFLGPIKELLEVYPAKCVVMDATLFAGSRRRISRECAELAVRCIDIAKTGAMKFRCSVPGIRMQSMRDR